ncbi:MAG: phosphoglycerate dehydrogenase [Deltaproteobacteria bacterium]|nr:phosphoglycerate dehydrogenase [Deltaproteobacteria bacterium]MBW1963000.1 phosphoglycerate dehydrogenase [Deltaproteobacteria bacterium]MBW1993169.1 phosphoglycerate dehydrogenase [Deltaproteobacteria bacterium]MBW2151821.1 phosphoglycerate dehydrogenase [Deltaproteobacteria bacterium]
MDENLNVLISDNLDEAGIDLFRKEPGVDVDIKTGLSEAQLKDIICSYHALIIRSGTLVTEDILASASRLRVIGRAGVGLDNVDVVAATRRGIVVMNTPGTNSVATAEHTIAMLLSLSRNIPRGTSSVKSGCWEKKQLQGREIFNKVIGVIGFGKIGSIVADRARGLKMKAIVYDPFVTSERIQKAGFKSVSLQELYRQSDYITVHVPKTKKTTNFINADAFEQMKTGVMIINCARGGIVDEKALYEAIISGKVAGAALDVFENEPPGSSPLLKLDQVICTPHIGASTQEAQANVSIAVANQVIKYLKNGTVLNAVNVPSVTDELLSRLRPYINLGDQIGCLQAQLCNGPITEVIIEYRGDFHGLELSAISSSVLKGLLAPTFRDDVNFVNAHIIAKEMGITVTETKVADAEEYTNLITVKVVTPEMPHTVSGTIFGKNQARIVRINSFRLEMIPKGHIALIHNVDRPGSIGEIGTTLGNHNINIGRMQVGQEEEGNRNLIFLDTDTPIPASVLEQLRLLPTVKSITVLEL